MDVDAVIAEATKQVATDGKASEGAKPEANTEAPKQEEAVDNTAKAEGDLSKKTDSELTAEQLAKRETNRKSHENSKIARMRRENRELKEAVERLLQQAPAKSPAANNPKDTQALGAPIKPKEESFSTWGEYQDAIGKYHEDLAEWKIEQKLSDRDKQATQSEKSKVLEAQTVHRIQEVAKQEEEFAKANPEYTALYNEYSDFMGNMPQNVAAALIEADNPTLALFTLMKEGTLESLEDMSPFKISMEIGKAELRGVSYINQNKATNAPSPITAARGTGNTGKSLADMSVDELMKKFNQR